MYVTHMSKMIQIRNVPDHIHRLLKMRAAEAGMSLSEFLVREVSLIADRPSLNEILVCPTLPQWSQVIARLGQRTHCAEN